MDAPADPHVTGLNRRLLLRFWEIAKPYWVSEERSRAWGFLALLVLLLLALTGLSVALIGQTGEFTSALAARDADRFWLSIRQCVVILLVVVPTYALHYWVRDSLGIHWRRWLTSRFLERYLGDHAYYALNARGLIDNPDQRIAEDIRSFTQESLYFLMIGLGASIQLVAFTGVLWSISRELVYFLLVYAIAGNLFIAVAFGRALIGLNYLQIRREADFRFSLVRIREHAEPIAFQRGEAQESSRAKRFFDAAFDNFRRLIRKQFVLNLCQYGFSMMTVVLPSAILASRVIAGELEVGRAVQAAGAFAAVLSAMTVIVEHFEGLSRFAAGIDRLHTFASELAAPRDEGTRAGSLIEIEVAKATRLALERATVTTPGRERTLLRDLSLSVDPGQGLMIVGGSGCGKSSLLRAVAGLWRAGEGRILCPPIDRIMFLPQQPYMALGSLRAQLLYPEDGRRVDDDTLRRLLQRVNLAELAGRAGGLDAELDWAKVLSVGEQQRLAFARVLLREPDFVMLDEATSALDADNEENLYRQLQATHTTPVSVSHRPTLLKFHSQVLELSGVGGWQLLPAEGYTFG
ncbi:ABC transporter ATP-binding protein/permease [Zeimonas arvi]|uniref:ABC transporter ATP-binding protein/permease n=1 Tax=Zeimonas arvi TaxID=2498847 RepID=A0A5C8NTZ9_9BURK|nr:ABC transporter ATP-binding protein/permease [Zeimonas arvi]TXL64629.1 ABC transporter ATP-binding protein/permease [Zeimonas arvi]